MSEVCQLKGTELQGTKTGHTVVEQPWEVPLLDSEFSY